MAEERAKWETKSKADAEKIRLLVEADSASAGGAGGGGLDEAAVKKKIKERVSGIAMEVYSEAKGVFKSGENYDGKTVLKQIKSLLKQVAKKG